MSPSTIAELFEQNPDQPYRITMASGDVVTVMSPKRAIVSELDLYVGLSDDPDAMLSKRVRIISIININLIEPVDRPQLPRRTRRRRG